ncbi:MAG TPA: hypothetical protein VMM58_14245 [Bacteroidota bacterium]|nr:hypothetical protein [Bacteroidota bacterium]
MATDSGTDIGVAAMGDIEAEGLRAEQEQPAFLAATSEIIECVESPLRPRALKLPEVQ